MHRLKQLLLEQLRSYTADISLAERLWEEIHAAYTESHRHYHTLSHLMHLLSVLQPLKEEIEDWEVLMFALFYHDLIYDPAAGNNEEKSAERAAQRLVEIGLAQDRISACRCMIMATKEHKAGSNRDTDFFTDADLSILGATAEVYAEYAVQVRMEYALYPDSIYRPGRKRVLQHFLHMDRIFKTPYFYARYEKQARENLSKEMELLS